MIHAGVIGLIDALNKFDRSKHVQFGSYAKFRIRGAILDSLREMEWGPRELRRKARRVEEAQRKLSLDLSRTPTEVEVAAELSLELREFQQLLSELDGLEEAVFTWSPWDGKEEDMCDYLPNAPEDTPFFRCMRSEMKELLARAVADLPEKEQQVLALYYFEELTMKEVARCLGLENPGYRRFIPWQWCVCGRGWRSRWARRSQPARPRRPAGSETGRRALKRVNLQLPGNASLGNRQSLGGRDRNRETDFRAFWGPPFWDTKVAPEGPIPPGSNPASG